jgi:hypothetical protein
VAGVGKKRNASTIIRGENRTERTAWKEPGADGTKTIKLIVNRMKERGTDSCVFGQGLKARLGESSNETSGFQKTLKILDFLSKQQFLMKKSELRFSQSPNYCKHKFHYSRL